jgi:hypothetical protein
MTYYKWCKLGRFNEDKPPASGSSELRKGISGSIKGRKHLEYMNITSQKKTLPYADV